MQVFAWIFEKKKKKIETLKDKEDPIGNRVRVKVVKTNALLLSNKGQN